MRDAVRRMLREAKIKSLIDKSTFIAYSIDIYFSNAKNEKVACQVAAERKCHRLKAFLVKG